MKRIFAGTVLLLVTVALHSQSRCISTDYTKTQLFTDPSLSHRFRTIEEFTDNIVNSPTNTARNFALPSVIRIPVVFHVLYHVPSENISDQVIMQQLESLNRDFRRRNPDTINAPSYFRSLGADMQFEFVLAKSD